MKCKFCGKKVFRTVVNKAGIETKWRICVNCSTINMFSYEKIKENEKGVFEYDFEN